MYRCENWTIKKAERWCFWTVLLEETLQRPLDSEIKPVNPKGNQPWIVIGRTDAEAEAPVLWPADAKSQLTGKDPDAGIDWGQEEKGTTEDDMVAQWTWVWANSGREWRTGKPGVLQFMGSQRVRCDLATELNWIVALFLVFWETSILFSTVTPPIYSPTNSVWGVPNTFLMTVKCCSFAFL